MTIYPKLKEMAEVLAEVVEVKLEKAMEVDLDEADKVLEARVVVVSTASHQTEVLI